eukprot:scaffold101193_cov63-Phaeocystis_antarctica.AAC.3
MFRVIYRPRATNLTASCGHVILRLLGRLPELSSSLTTISTLTYASGGMGGIAPSSLTNEPLPSSSLVSGRVAAAAFSTAAARPSGDRATHNAASSAEAKLPRLTFLPPRITYA